jgi:hypothetical protein
MKDDFELVQRDVGFSERSPGSTNSTFPPPGTPSAHGTLVSHLQAAGPRSSDAEERHLLQSHCGPAEPEPSTNATHIRQTFASTIPSAKDELTLFFGRRQSRSRYLSYSGIGAPVYIDRTESAILCLLGGSV